MNTKPLSDKDIKRCEYERIDADHRSYCCDRRAVCRWQATADVRIYLCKSCTVWLETLESLGHES